VLDVGKFLRAADLAPPLGDAVPVEDEGGVGAIGPDPFTRDRAVAVPL
jgi:hypothetical protein